jgi:hypothetical protein
VGFLVNRELKSVDRDDILGALTAALEPLDHVNAMWEAGAISWGRLDRYSDIDLQIDVKDNKVMDTVRVVEKTLKTLSPIQKRYEVIGPTHGHWQCFYKLKKSTDFLLVDLCIIKHSAKDKFLERERHGEPVFYFNKKNTIRTKGLDKKAYAKTLSARLERIKVRLDLFNCFVEKELQRGNHLEAIDIYRAVVVGSLIEVLRMRYHPLHHDFGTRYLHYELPPSVVKKLKTFMFIKDEHDLRKKHKAALLWFYKIVSGLDTKRLASRL